MGDSHPAHLFTIILAVEDVPFLAAFENFLLLRTDLLADLGVHLLFFFEETEKNLYHVLPNGGAVFDEFHILDGHENVGNDVGQAHGLFTA